MSKQSTLFNKKDKVLFHTVEKEIMYHLHNVKQVDWVDDIKGQLLELQDTMKEMSELFHKEILKEKKDDTDFIKSLKKIKNNENIMKQLNNCKKKHQIRFIKIIFKYNELKLKESKKENPLREFKVEIFFKEKEVKSLIKNYNHSNFKQFFSELLDLFETKTKTFIIREIVIDILRAPISVGKKYEKFYKALYTSGFLKADFQKTHEEDKDNPILEIIRLRDETVRISDVFFHKLRDLQNQRTIYLGLTYPHLNELNNDYNEIKKKIRTILSNLEIDLNAHHEKVKKQLDNNNYLIQLHKDICKLKILLYQLYSLRRKMSDIYPYYPSYRDELLKDRSLDVIKPIKYKKNTIKRIYTHILPDIFKRKNDDTFSYSNFEEYIQKKQYALNQNDIAELKIKEEKERETKWLKNGSKENKIISRVLTILKDVEDIKEINTIKEIIKNQFETKKEEIKDDTYFFFNEICKVDYRDNWAMHNELEKIRFNWLIKQLDFLTLFNEAYRADKSSGVKMFKRKSVQKYKDKKGKEISFINKIVSVQDKVNQINEDPKSYTEPDIEIQPIIEGMANRIEFLKPEIEFYIRSTKQHKKRYTNRILEGHPIDFKALKLKNKIIKNTLRTGYKFAGPFQRIIEIFDKFIHSNYSRILADINTISPKENETDFHGLFKSELWDKISHKIYDIRIGQYNIPNSYLHSSEFTNATDSMQILGGGFGIWNQEVGELVNLQDRNYCPVEYRPNEQDMWYDFTNRIIDNGKWYKDKYEESIDLLFLSERSQSSLPEFYQNLTSYNNILNDVEKINSSLFAEDGEVSAFTLLYRLSNLFCHTTVESLYTYKTSNNEIKNTNIRTNTLLNSSNKFWSNEIENLLKTYGTFENDINNLRSYDLTLPDSVKTITKNSNNFKKNQDYKISVKSILNFINEESIKFINMLTLTNEELETQFAHIQAKLNLHIDSKNKLRITEKEKKNIEKVFSGVSILNLNNEEKRIIDYISMLCWIINFLEKRMIDYNSLIETEERTIFNKYCEIEIRHYNTLLHLIILIIVNKYELKLELKHKEITGDTNPYDSIAFEGRKNKFYSDIKKHLDKNPSNFMEELRIQGLIGPKDQDQTDDIVNDDSIKYIQITERYINLCKFIYNELDAEKRGYKVRCKYTDDRFISPLNKERYFIDRKLSKFKEFIVEGDRNAIVQYRSDYLRNIRRSVLDIVESRYKIGKIEKNLFFSQISAMLHIILEASYYLYPAAAAVSKERYYPKGSKGIWKVIKDEIDHMSKFPISPYFAWRANHPYAMSNLVIPLGVSHTNKNNKNIGYLTIGFRNLFRASNGDYIHVNHETEEYFKEYINSVRTIFQPLIHPFMDKIYYESIFTRTVKKTALIASVAQVMTRNMSHNFGSHVLTRLSNDFKTSKIITIGKKKIENNDLHNFISFLRTRMDFLSDISSGMPEFGIPLRLLNDIGPYYLKNQASNRFQKITFNYISGIDDINIDKIVIEFKKAKNPSQTKNIQAEIQDSLVVIPNGIMGTHAFHIIIENLIRNICKYEWDEKSEQVCISILFEDYLTSERFVKVSMKSKILEKNGMYKVFPKKTFEKISSIVYSPLINKNSNEINKEYLGYAEIKIAAAYLRMKNIIELENLDFEPSKKESHTNLLNFSAKNPSELEHSFYLETVKLVDIRISKNELKKYSFLKNNIKIFANHGILISHDFKKNHSNYGITIFVGDSTNRNLERTWRCIKIEPNDFYKSLKDTSLDKNPNLEKIKLKIIDFAWKIWINKFEKKCSSKFESCDILLFENSNDSIDIFNAKDILGNKSISSNDKIVFESHCKHLKNDVLNKTNIYNIKYYDNYKNYTAFGYWLNKIKELGLHDGDSGKREIFELAFSNVVVLDERVQREICKQSLPLDGLEILTTDKNIKNKLNEKKELKLNYFYEYSNLYIPDQKVIDLSKPSNLKSDKLISYLQNISNIHYIIVHKGLIEKQGIDENTYKLFLKDKIKIDNQFNIVYSTGRGSLKNKNHNTLVISYSSLQQNIIEEYSKFHLVKELNLISNEFNKIKT